MLHGGNGGRQRELTLISSCMGGGYTPWPKTPAVGRSAGFSIRRWPSPCQGAPRAAAVGEKFRNLLSLRCTSRGTRPRRRQRARRSPSERRGVPPERHSRPWARFVRSAPLRRSVGRRATSQNDALEAGGCGRAVARASRGRESESEAVANALCLRGGGIPHHVPRTASSWIVLAPRTEPAHG